MFNLNLMQIFNLVFMLSKIDYSRGAIQQKKKE